MLLILAGITLSSVLGQDGIFNRTETAGAKYNEAKAREVLETVLLADGQYEKNINPEYNQDDFLDKLIKNEIPGTEIKGDVAIVGEWAFELDRSVPKIGRALGKVDKLVFPTVNATVDLATDKKNATINITAKEETNGINKIEIWLLGEKIKEYTYDNVKTEITVNPPYIATQNGKYTIKAYGDLMASKIVEVTDIVASVTFEPNGNNDWQKSHSTVVTIQETADKVVKAKYVWLPSVTEPNDNQFTEEQTFRSGDTITKNEVTGTHYLWTMLETQSGEKTKWRSEAFYFDNEAPTISSFKVEETGIGLRLKFTAQDEQSGLSSYEFYIDGNKEGNVQVENINTIETFINTFNGFEGEGYNCEIIVKDLCGNIARAETESAPKEYEWEKWNATFTRYKTVSTSLGQSTISGGNISNCYGDYKFNSSTGTFSGVGTAGTHSGGSAWYVVSSSSVTVYAFSHMSGSSKYVYNRTRITSTGDPSSCKKGSTSYGIVTSKNINEYPENGYKDGYYYVLIKTE